MALSLNGRKIRALSIRVERGFSGGYHFTAATFTDGADLSNDELDQLDQEYPDYPLEFALDHGAKVGW